MFLQHIHLSLLWFFSDLDSKLIVFLFLFFCKRYRLLCRWSLFNNKLTEGVYLFRTAKVNSFFWIGVRDVLVCYFYYTVVKRCYYCDCHCFQQEHEHSTAGPENHNGYPRPALVTLRSWPTEVWLVCGFMGAKSYVKWRGESMHLCD